MRDLTGRLIVAEHERVHTNDDDVSWMRRPYWGWFGLRQNWDRRIGRSFDVIESVGVLHHLADPQAGWRVLVSLLRPGGLS